MPGRGWTAALTELPDAGRADAVSLRVVLAFDGLFRADLEAMREAAGRRSRLARPLGERPLHGDGGGGAGPRLRLGRRDRGRRGRARGAPS